MRRSLEVEVLPRPRVYIPNGRLAWATGFCPSTQGRVPRGQTPVLQYSFSWKQLSVIAGASFWRFCFCLYGGTIRTPQVIEFLKALQATIGKKLLIIWDRLQAHRSKLVRAHIEA